LGQGQQGGNKAATRRQQGGNKAATSTVSHTSDQKHNHICSPVYHWQRPVLWQLRVDRVVPALEGMPSSLAGLALGTHGQKAGGWRLNQELLHILA